MDRHKAREENYKKARSFKKAFRRFEDVKTEFFRIQWTEDKKVWYYTRIVLISVCLSGVLLYLADLIVQKGLSVVSFLLRMVLG